MSVPTDRTGMATASPVPTVVVPLAMPRLVTGIPLRCREPESVAVIDELPLEVRTAAKADAPVAFRKPGSGDRPGTPYRAYAGRAYARASAGAPTFADAWRALSAALLDGVQDDLGWRRLRDMAGPPGHGRIVGWAGELAGASRRRGFVPAGGIAFKEVSCDGLEVQARSARRLADRMLRIGEDLWFQVDLPRIEVHPFDRLVGTSLQWGNVEWAHEAETGRPWTAGHFRIDRPEEARAYGTALAAALGLPAHPEPNGAVEIADAAALDGLYRAAGGDVLLGLRGIVRSVGLALQGDLGLMPDAAVIAYADGLRLARDGDEDGLHAWMGDGLGTVRHAIAERGRAIGRAAPVKPLEAALVRYREIERPRLDFASGDAEALSGLSF